VTANQHMNYQHCPSLHLHCKISKQDMVQVDTIRATHYKASPALSKSALQPLQNKIWYMRQHNIFFCILSFFFFEPHSNTACLNPMHQPINMQGKHKHLPPAIAASPSSTTITFAIPPFPASQASSTYMKGTLPKQSCMPPTKHNSIQTHPACYESAQVPQKYSL
jgi:hypothetical protein